MTILWIDDRIEEIKLNNWLDPQKYSICYEDDFTRARRLIKEKALLSYDAIILDVDFERSKTTDEIELSSNHFGLEVDEFKKEAGFHLFIELIEAGFPKERIVCFTGNVTLRQIELEYLKLLIEPDESKQYDIAEEIDWIMGGKLTPIVEKQIKMTGEPALIENLFPVIETHIYKEFYTKAKQKNTANEFCSKFFASRINPPKIIPKTNQECLPLWVDLTISDDYVQLRRLLIDYSLFLIKKLEHNNLEIHERLKKDKKFCFNNNEAISLLNNIIHLLPIQKPESKSELSHTFKQLVFIISHHWDNLEWSTHTNFKIVDENDSTQVKEKKIALKCFFIIMKTVRNWSHHGVIFEKIDEKTLAYLFLINARALFDLDDKCSSHETKLLEFLCLPKDPMGSKEFKKKCGDSYDSRKLTLNDKYAEIHNTFKHPWDLAINDILNGAKNKLDKFQSQDHIEKDLFDGLYDCFWFLTSSPKFKYEAAKAAHSNTVQLNIKFHFFNYEAFPFISDFSRHLFYKTFNQG